MMEALQKLMSELDIGLNCEEIYSEEDAIKILEIVINRMSNTFVQHP